MRWIVFLLLWNGQIVEDPTEYTEKGCYHVVTQISKGEIRAYKGVPIVHATCELRIDV